jgi:hypothetical protein
MLQIAASAFHSRNIVAYFDCVYTSLISYLGTVDSIKCGKTSGVICTNTFDIGWCSEQNSSHRLAICSNKLGRRQQCQELEEAVMRTNHDRSYVQPICFLLLIYLDRSMFVLYGCQLAP